MFRLSSLLFAACLVASCGHVPPQEQPQSGLLLHAPFDGTTTSRVAAGAPRPILLDGTGFADKSGLRFVDGVFGRAVVGLPRSFDALANVSPERGTIAFFYRPAQPDADFDPLQIRAVDFHYWEIYMRIFRWKQQLNVEFVDENLKLKPTPLVRGAKITGDWQHLAVTWDQARGVVLYLDGRQVSSTWGRQSWVSRGVDPAEILLSTNTGAAYDELYVFDRVLSAEQIQAIARENRIPSDAELRKRAQEFGELDRRNRLRELSWTRPLAGAPRLALGTETRIRQVTPSDARAQKKAMGAVFDGKLGEGWPPRYSYEQNGGDGLSVKTEELYDLVTIEGSFGGDVFAGRSVVRPETARPLATILGGAHRRYLRLDRLREGWISFFHRPGKRWARGWIGELGFFQQGMAAVEGGSTRPLFIGGRDAPDDGPTALGVELRGRFGPGDRASFPLVVAAPRARHEWKPDALRYRHLIVPAASQPRGLLGLRLKLWLRGIEPDDTVRIEVRDAELPGRRIVSLDFVLDPGTPLARTEAQPLDLLIDLRDRLIPAGKPVWVSIVFSSDVELMAGGEQASRVDLYESDVERVLPEFVADELLFVRSRFREQSEARQWNLVDVPERQLTPVSHRARELFKPLMTLRRYAPEDARVQALWAWTHKRAVDRGAVDLAHVSGRTPRWALLQREIVRASRGILHWWVDHRQVASGEFGDDWNDDTVLIQNFPSVALLGDPEDRLRDAARCTADGVHRERMSLGINRRVMDSAHAYEDGLNAQSALALMDWGNPVALERLMEASGTVANRLTRKDARGRRRFATSYFGASSVAAGRGADAHLTGVDIPDNAQLFHSALLLAYYARNPEAVKLAQEWIDGWLDYYDQAERSGKHPLDSPYPSRTDISGKVLAWDTKARGYGYVSVFQALADLTGAPRYRRAARYWTGEYAPRGAGAFMRGNSSAYPALELIDRDRFSQDLVAWAEEADLSRPFQDRFGRIARQRYMKWEVTGDESAVYASLEATLRNLRRLYPAYTWGEPTADRVWLPIEGLLVMMQGGVSHVRSQLWPRHYTSYEGFSDFGAWVREKSDTKLRIWFYSFARQQEEGAIRVWRTPPGRYTVRMGPDRDLDGEPDEPETLEVELHRAARIPLGLPPGERFVVTLEPIESAEEEPARVSYWDRPDLAVSLQIPGGPRPGVNVTVHNLGSGAAKGARVRVRSETGRVIAERYVGSLDGVRGFEPSRRVLEFPRVRPRPGLVVEVDPDDAIDELNEENNRARPQREGCSSPVPAGGASAGISSS